LHVARPNPDSPIRQPSRNFIVAIADLLLPGVGTLQEGEKGRRNARPTAPLCYGSTTLICEAAFPPPTPPVPGTLRPRVRDFLSLGAFLFRSGPSWPRVDLYAS